ncbi:MAG: hypothetical protein JWO36_3626 [Myxococcales bacterium]|nr:hypothetical protein [Myxococcales bacterium]
MDMMSEKPELGGLPRGLDLRPLGIIALAGALVWSTSITATTWRGGHVKAAHRTIRVTGSAKKRIVSDLIQWEAVLEAHAADRTAAYKRLHEETDKAVEFLKAQGIQPDEIRPQSATFEEEFDTQEEFKVLAGMKEPTRLEKKVFKDFVTREVIEIHSKDVPRIEKASREITSLLEDGVSITSGAPQYFYTRLGELKVEMLAAAGKDARARATNIINSAGGADIGKLIVADMGIININPANSTQTSEEGNNDTSSLEKDIITIVHAEFELD